MFENLEKAPADQLFKLVGEYNQDTHEDKMNLVVGAFNNEQGKVPLLDSVHQAEQKLLDNKLNILNIYLIYFVYMQINFLYLANKIKILCLKKSKNPNPKERDFTGLLQIECKTY